MQFPENGRARKDHKFDKLIGSYADNTTYAKYRPTVELDGKLAMTSSY